ncbi:hypothetical protein PghCCS26_03080 [Paenibacillus glycanilyticus]|uniref:Uncharacterized protein n=1 Tax=Paenibacillus glycanilyticus TaxID=126569 RepID=A0ABQ6NDS0_9BACL|nr:hypothetical protein [Paenibacillus glycanilyticus]GMK43181.1 hypothetical protein PghCCS26_03080 [Paenibacillus glycanilyticus]
MNIEYRLAKSMMENEEGLNHLWIRLAEGDQSEITDIQINVGMPEGIFRLPNLNHHKEDEAGTIVLAKTDDLMLEIYTTNQIACGDHAITVDIVFMDWQKHRCMQSVSIPIRVVLADEMETVEIDDEVVNRVTQLAIKQASNELDEFEVIGIRPKRLTLNNEYSFLEQKYRVDG